MYTIVRYAMATENHTQTIHGCNDEAANAAAEIAAALRLLSDPTRLRIFLMLRRGEACVCEVAEELGLAENLVSHHLAVLRKAGTVSDRRDPTDARWVYYQLEPTALRRLATVIGEIFDTATLGRRIPTCGPAAASVPIMPVRRASRSTTPSSVTS